MALIPFEIPLSAGAQKFSVTLATVAYNMRIVWNDASKCWILDIAAQDNTPLVEGIPLLPGVDLFEQYAHLKLGGGLMVMTDTDLEALPTYENLGANSHLYFVVGSP